MADTRLRELLARDVRGVAPFYPAGTVGSTIVWFGSELLCALAIVTFATLFPTMAVAVAYVVTILAIVITGALCL